MIDKVEFTAKNLTSNAGVLLLLNYTEEQRIFQELDEIVGVKNLWGFFLPQKII
jgi:hypothetical protein